MNMFLHELEELNYLIVYSLTEYLKNKEFRAFNFTKIRDNIVKI